MFKRKRIVYKNLYAVIVKQHLSITDLANKIKVAPSALEKQLFGNESINLNVAFAIAKILKCDIHYLFQELVP